MNEKIYILLPVHNRREITRRFIECLKKQSYQNYHLILIDDGSTDGTAEMVKQNITSLTIIKGKGDWWWAGSLQMGYQWLKSHMVSTCDIVLIINDDTEFEESFLKTATDLLMHKSDTLLLAECYDRHSRQFLGSGVCVDWRYLRFRQALKPDEINCLSTRGLFLKVESLYEIGGFYHRILPHYASDYEFTIRAYNKGMKLTTDPNLRLWLNEDPKDIENLQDEPFLAAIKKIFSKKTKTNPFAWTIFILLSCPWRWKIVNCVRVWLNVVASIIKLTLSKIKTDFLIG